MLKRSCESPQVANRLDNASHCGRPLPTARASIARGDPTCIRPDRATCNPTSRPGDCKGDASENSPRRRCIAPFMPKRGAPDHCGNYRAVAPVGAPRRSRHAAAGGAVDRRIALGTSQMPLRISAAFAAADPVRITDVTCATRCLVTREIRVIGRSDRPPHV